MRFLPKTFAGQTSFYRNPFAFPFGEHQLSITDLHITIRGEIGRNGGQRSLEKRLFMNNCTWQHLITQEFLFSQNEINKLVQIWFYRKKYEEIIRDCFTVSDILRCTSSSRSCNKESAARPSKWCYQNLRQHFPTSPKSQHDIHATPLNPSSLWHLSKPDTYLWRSLNLTLQSCFILYLYRLFQVIQATCVCFSHSLSQYKSHNRELKIV